MHDNLVVFCLFTKPLKHQQKRNATASILLYYEVKTTYLQPATLSHSAQCTTLQRTIFGQIKAEWDINNSLQNMRTTAPQQHHNSNSRRGH